MSIENGKWKMENCFNDFQLHERLWLFPLLTGEGQGEVFTCKGRVGWTFSLTTSVEDN